METIAGHLYDFPKYYDLIFGSDCQAELKFLKAAFKAYSPRPVKQLFEPACGTGRLLFWLAKAGYNVQGNDLNPHAVEYCNLRFTRASRKPPAVVGDMSDFRLSRPVDAGFNLINTFRHLPSEQAAASHLECMAKALKPGGLYLLGLHLTPRTQQHCTEESWSATRGHLSVVSRLWSKGVDLKKRVERIGMTYDVYTPTKQFRIEDETVFRTYTANQMAQLLLTVPEFECVGTYDFRYDLSAPIEIDPETEDVVYVLRRR